MFPCLYLYQVKSFEKCKWFFSFVFLSNLLPFLRKGCEHLCTYLTLKIENVYKLKEKDLKWKTTKKKEGEQSIVLVGEVTRNENILYWSEQKRSQF
jgi:hypothetical protein